MEEWEWKEWSTVRSAAQRDSSALANCYKLAGSSTGNRLLPAT